MSVATDFEILTPPKGRPYWLAAEASPLELGYLSWGYRWYHEAPIRPSPHHGWHYFVVLEGSPLVMIRGCTLQAEPGTVTLCHPECPIGHLDRPGERCQILTWIWRTPPSHSQLVPAAGKFLKLELDRDQLRHLKRLHAQCREAVADPSERSMLQAKSARLQLDLCLLETRSAAGPASEAGFLINRSIDFLRSHLSEPEPVRHLCEHLQLSEASLKRIFRDHTGKSPRSFALEWRMRLALERLRPANASVKAIAYALGYRHPNDFSRAFKRHYGRSATQMLRESRDPSLAKPSRSVAC